MPNLLSEEAIEELRSLRNQDIWKGHLESLEILCYALENSKLPLSVELIKEVLNKAIARVKEIIF